MSDGALKDGEWFVDQKFLIDGRKELEGKQVLRLNFSGASLHEATVEENGVKRLSITSETDMAVSQCSFPKVEKTLKVPSARRDKTHCVALAAGYLKAIELAAAAVEEELVDVFPPAAADGLVIFRAGHDKQTSCIGGILPGVSEASVGGDEDDQEDDEEKPRRSRKKSERQGELPGSAN